MARIPDDEITRLKTEVSLQRLVESQGIKLKRHGKDLIGLCPFHDDKSPSLVITPAQNLWHCLGACNTGGTVIDWVMKRDNISFRHAVTLLQGRPEQPANQSIPPLAAGSDNQALLNQVINHYHQCLLQSPEALAYLDKRGLKNKELINHFKLGFSNRNLAYRLSPRKVKAGNELRTQLQEIGILRKSGHEHFNGSLVIPTINDNQVSEVYARKIHDDLREGTPTHLYLPGPHAGVFNVDALRASKENILCESLIDALTFWNAGYKNVTTSYGINGFTDELLSALKENKTERILIAYDRDEAGEKSACDLAACLLKEGIDCYRILFPKNMDANEYALSVQPAEKSLGVVIRAAQWMGKGKKKNPGTQVEIKTKTKQESEQEPTTLIKASPATTPQPTLTVEEKDNEVIIKRGDRRYRVRGLQKNLSYEQMKINLFVAKAEDYYVDTVELYAARQRHYFIQQAAEALNVNNETIRKDLGLVLLKLEALQEKQINKTLKQDNKKTELTEAEKTQAIHYLKQPNLLNNILEDFNRAGVIGEETNKLAGYLAAVSRKLPKPLAVMVQSSSAAGKSSLMEAILAMMPVEEKTQYSAMTGQSLFYMGETNLKNKILAIAEEEGAQNASYALKLLQSEGEVTIASTGKDANTGQLVTQQYRVEGPVMLFMTTTAIDIDEELLNRCLVLTVNETRQQTQAIHKIQRQRRTLEGLLEKQNNQNILTLHHNTQRLLKSLAVINPYAEELSFLDDRTRLRRDHEKYLTLIDSIALLHQYQRETKTIKVNGETIDYIEATLEDIEIANRLAHEILGKTLDELPPQTRKLLTRIQTIVVEQCKQQSLEQNDYRFSRKTIRDKTGWSDNQLKVHCKRLEDMEYLLVHRGGRGQSLEYELLYDGDIKNDQPQLMGLIETDKLKKHHYDKKKLGVKNKKLASSCAQVAPKLAPGSGDKDTVKAPQDKPNGKDVIKNTENARLYKNKNHPSYCQNNLNLAAKG